MELQKRYKYTMNETMNVAKKAAIDLEFYLRTLPETVDVVNVEKDPNYQTKDIDLVYFYKNKKGVKKRTTIEIKGDRYHHTGNFFFETHSNLQKNTPGCFIYTEADYLFYYFVDKRELHILPVIETREWFLKNINRFAIRGTSTQIGNKQKKGYTSSGRLVPRDIVHKEVKKARIIRLG